MGTWAISQKEFKKKLKAETHGFGNLKKAICRKRIQKKPDLKTQQHTIRKQQYADTAIMQHQFVSRATKISPFADKTKIHLSPNEPNMVWSFCIMMIALTLSSTTTITR